MGKMSLNEKLQVTDTNLSRLDSRTDVIAEIREALVAEKAQAILSEYRGTYPEDLFERTLRGEQVEDIILPCVHSFVPSVG